jgi:hypothetical protein
MNKRSRIRASGGVVAVTAVALMTVQGSSADAGSDRTPVAEHTTVCVGTRPTHSLPGGESALLRVARYTDKRGGTRYKSVFTAALFRTVRAPPGVRLAGARTACLSSRVCSPTRSARPPGSSG